MCGLLRVTSISKAPKPKFPNTKATQRLQTNISKPTIPNPNLQTNVPKTKFLNPKQFVAEECPARVVWSIPSSALQHSVSGVVGCRGVPCGFSSESTVSQLPNGG